MYNDTFMLRYDWFVKNQITHRVISSSGFYIYLLYSSYASSCPIHVNCPDNVYLLVLMCHFHSAEDLMTL
jgi:hypothetical protein